MTAMDLVVPFLIVVSSVVAMEGVATFVHSTIMHGSGWEWHRSHHEPQDGAFERNDLYAICFTLMAIGLMALGHVWAPLFWVAVGMGIYGLLYTLLHDGLVHQRWPFRHVPRRGYLKRLYQAHKLHHAVEGRTGGVSFGFLYAPPVDRLRAKLKGQAANSSR